MNQQILKILLLISLSSLHNSLVAQQKQTGGFDKQLSILYENDFIALHGTDGYYTSGQFIKYSSLAKKTKTGVIKIINQFEVGQKIFTPGIREVFVITELDRPITGYLYINYNRLYYKENSKYLRLGVSAGTIGPASMAEQALGVIHPIFNIGAEWWNWMFDYQLKNEPGINGHATYAFSFLKNDDTKFQITPVSNFTLGTSFTNISQSVLFQFGKGNQMYESAFWGSRLQRGGTAIKKEFFVYYQPELLFQIYNATVQGGMFRNDKGRIVSKNTPFVFSNKAGLMYGLRRYSGGIHVNFQSKEARSQERRHAYGGLQFAYHFK